MRPRHSNTFHVKDAFPTQRRASYELSSGPTGRVSYQKRQAGRDYVLSDDMCQARQGETTHRHLGASETSTIALSDLEPVHWLHLQTEF